MKKIFALLMMVMIAGVAVKCDSEPEWESLFNGENLDGWFVRGEAEWWVQDGIMVGEGRMGHIYSDVTVTDFEMKGMYRITSEEGAASNSGVYFRANPPADNPDGFPRGYEAQICPPHDCDAYTGWLWKPGTPTKEATELLTEEGEWFSMHIKAVGNDIQFRINDELVMTHSDSEYETGHFAIQVHNPGMRIEAKDLYYRNLGQSE